MKNNYQAIGSVGEKKLSVLLWSILIGLLSGLVVVGYRAVLNCAEKLAFIIYRFLREYLIWFPVWMTLLIVMGIAVGKMVKKNDMISGSGIPQVKGIMMGYIKDTWFGTLCLKFIGGTVAILGGLSLGREGPSVQLGACVAEGVTKKVKATRMEKKVLIASGASAGLSAAFNAPLAGVVFALEEIFKYFSPLILLSTMAAAVAADFVAKNVFGMEHVFQFPEVGMIPLSSYWILLLLGAVLGAAGAFYNKVLLATQRLYRKLLPQDKRPLIPFILAGILGLTFPSVLCGGHEIISQFNLSTGIFMLFLLLLVKFLFSMISFGSGSPGGIFFPLLIIGGTIGAIFGSVSVHWLGFSQNLFFNFVILAMAGYFTAIVRAPITGIILITEMTGSLHHLLSLTVVSITAYIVADLLKSAPVYESLLENLLKTKNILPEKEEHSKKILIDTIVQHGSKIAGKQVKEIKWPRRSLLLSIKRMETEIIPKGDTIIQEGDYLILITDLNSEWKTRERINTLACAPE